MSCSPNFLSADTWSWSSQLNPKTYTALFSTVSFLYIQEPISFPKIVKLANVVISHVTINPQPHTDIKKQLKTHTKHKHDAGLISSFLAPDLLLGYRVFCLRPRPLVPAQPMEFTLRDFKGEIFGRNTTKVVTGGN